MEYVVLLSVVMVVFLYIMGSYAPLFKIKLTKKDNIRKNGLIHFTSMDCWESIYKNGLMGKESDMGFPETLLGKMVWTYPYGDKEHIENKHKKLLKTRRGKTNPKRYGICISVTGISEEDLNRLYTRHGFIKDGAIVYRGEWLKVKKIELIKEWE